MGIKSTLTFVALSAIGCGSSQAPAPAEPKAPVGEIERFMPLANDTVYSYETFSEGSGERGVLVLRVHRPRPELAELDVAGRVQRLTVSDQGLQLVSGGYLLLAPLKEGAEWLGDFGKVRVTGVNRTAEVPAGRFTGCLETVEEIAAPEVKKRTTTLFCPDVGITQRETEGEAAGQYVLERIVLKSYGKAFSLENPPP